MSEWMNIIAKRELTDEERADIQNFVNQQNGQVPSMIDLPEPQQEEINVPPAPNLPPSTLPLHPKLKKLGFRRKKSLFKPKQRSNVFKPKNQQPQQPQQPNKL